MLFNRRMPPFVFSRVREKKGPAAQQRGDEGAKFAPVAPHLPIAFGDGSGPPLRGARKGSPSPARGQGYRIWLENQILPLPGGERAG